MDCLHCFWTNLVIKGTFLMSKDFVLGTQYHIILCSLWFMYQPLFLYEFERGITVFWERFHAKNWRKKSWQRKRFETAPDSHICFPFFCGTSASYPFSLPIDCLEKSTHCVFVKKKSADPLKILLFQYCAVYTLEKNQCNFSKVK